MLPFLLRLGGAGRDPKARCSLHIADIAAVGGVVGGIVGWPKRGPRMLCDGGGALRRASSSNGQFCSVRETIGLRLAFM